METEKQIITGLPVENIRKIIIEENNESLTKIIPNERILLLTEHKFLYPYLRKSVVEKLYKAGANLPNGYKILVVTAYRPISMQKKLWRQRLIQLAKRHPIMMVMNFRRWLNTARRYTSPPGGSSHQCGAAVDVTVIDEIGNRLDMGTTLTDFGKKVNTFCDEITSKQEENRKLLFEAMTMAGFVNYPLEWWHYSYGDRMWAAYTKKDKCFYGPLTQEV